MIKLLTLLLVKRSMCLWMNVHTAVGIDIIFFYNVHTGLAILLMKSLHLQKSHHASFFSLFLRLSFLMFFPNYLKPGARLGDNLSFSFVNEFMFDYLGHRDEFSGKNHPDLDEP